MMTKIKQLFAQAANGIAHQAKVEMLEKEKEETLALIKNAAQEGTFSIYVSTLTYKRWSDIKKWLEECDYVVKWNIGDIVAEIVWDDVAIQRVIVCTPPKPAKITYTEPTKAICWIWDKEQYDYICPDCGKHSEYVSNFCPNCGGRRYEIKEKENN